MDVWACGVILYQILFGERPFDAMQRTGIGFGGIHLMERCGPKLVIPESPATSDSTKRFLRKCLSYSPSDRPNVLKVFDDEWFRDQRLKTEIKEGKDPVQPAR